MVANKNTEAGSDDAKFLELTTQIVSAFVGKNAIGASDLPGLISTVHDCLVGLETSESKAATAKPAVSIKKSITEDYLICLEDGEKFKSLRRHLRSKYDMSPEEYREKWGLPYVYPMVAPSYARQRSKLAKEMGLGQNKK